jgi:two-component system chemotaxis response regulator CheY
MVRLTGVQASFLSLVPYARCTSHVRLCSERGFERADLPTPFPFAEGYGLQQALEGARLGFEIEKDGASMKTLIVEDDFTNRILLQAFLSRYGECHMAVDGFEALEAFNLACSDELPYNLICMDIMMPGMNGKEAVRRLRAVEESRGVRPGGAVKIIMTTGLTDTKDVFESFRALCDAYVTKPIDTARMLEHLNTFQLV